MFKIKFKQKLLIKNQNIFFYISIYYIERLFLLSAKV